MSFREKSAWISFVCLLLLTLGVIFSLQVHTNNGPGYDAASQLHLALATFVGFLVLQLVLHLIVAARSPKDARTPKDERERFIELRAARIGFYSLVVGELTAMALMHLHRRPDILMWSVLLAIFIAWLIKLGSEIVLYRRG